MSTAFGCTIQGRVEPAEVLRLVQAVLDAGVDRVGLADTVGYADPAMVRELFELVPAGGRRQAQLRPLPRHARPGPGQRAMPRCEWASPASTPAWAASAAARMRPAPAATWPPKTWPTCWPAWASRPARISTRCWRCARKVAQWLRRRDAARHAVARRPAQDDAARDGRGSIAHERTRQAPHRSPCTGLRVVEFTHMVMGPTCGMVLADMGAEVIKIEPIDGDRTRRLLGAGAGFFPMFNRNKKSIGIDLHSARGRGDGAARCAPRPTWWPRTSSRAPWPSTAWTTRASARRTRG